MVADGTVRTVELLPDTEPETPGWSQVPHQ
jgi:hypothetical protein